VSRVLIIDDDADACELFSFVLTQANHDVVFATDGRAGLDLVHEVQPEVVLVDIFMPRMDGLLVIQELRRRCPTIKIVAVSAGMMISVGTSLLDLAPGAGADVVLRKPLEPHVLQETIARLVAGG
jgi:CheY-like chemotaxis protein